MGYRITNASSGGSGFSFASISQIYVSKNIFHVVVSNEHYPSGVKVCVVGIIGYYAS